MICKCTRCQSKLCIEDSDLSKLKKPVFKCPKCSSRLAIRASHAKCGKCNKPFKFQVFKLEASKGLVKCPSCNIINRIKI